MEEIIVSTPKCFTKYCTADEDTVKEETTDV